MTDLREPLNNLTVEDLRTLIRQEMRLLMADLGQAKMPVPPPPIPDELRNQPLNFPVDDYGAWDDSISLQR